MGHDLHFLERLERLRDDQVSQALSFYRDHDLVKSVLKELNLPEAIDRVAISLDDPVEGPFIIVHRSGRFITCLGEGMHVGDRYVVSKERFDSVTKDIERVREIIAEVKARPLDEIKRQNAKFIEHGERVTREDFDRAKDWFPLNRLSVFKSLIDASCELDDLYSVLDRRNADFKKRDEEKLYRFCQLYWALGHFTLLLGTDSGAFVRKIIEHSSHESTFVDFCLSAANFLEVGGLSRGAWLAGMVGKPILPVAKRRYQTTINLNHVINGGFALMAVGLTHRKLRAEVSKVLAPNPAAEGRDDFDGHMYFFRWGFSNVYDASCRGELDVGETFEQLGAKFIYSICGNVPAGHALHFPEGEPVPRSLWFPLVLRTSVPLIEEGWSYFKLLVEWMPQITRASASDFYVEEKYKEIIPCGWDIESGTVLLKARQGFLKYRHRPPATPKSPPKPERNAPCPCGSQKKYKRCCALKSSDGEASKLATD